MAWAPDYLTVDEYKSDYKDIPDDADDARIAWAITTASRSVDDHCSQGVDRQFGTLDGPQDRLYTATWSSERCRWVVEVDDFYADVTVVAGGATITGSLALPLNAAKKGRPWEKLVLPRGTDLTGEEGEVIATTRWGWPAVPVPVKQATALQTNRLLARGDSPFGVAGSPDAGGEMRLLSRVDPDVAVSLQSYVRRGWWVA
ncbi:hypothetical protein ALI144C_44845 [Actinosynnema sp. ALI-1.44]|uniref:hypothetical protein n=1 Tax=Actinosynnema sp. ALI-1.44 TaxID=1933779 RepID=UPI00097CA2B7|nr:hypothetical protein [Actinosynnema sp. ALI-1.44]ONI73082.1 hypothetical protein ALI144C_44845 [Actinosynnema sp. ALI-1.44]